MKKIAHFLFLSASLLALTACSTGSQSPAPIVDGSGTNQATTSEGLGQQAGLSGNNVVESGHKNTIYFGLNKSVISAQYQGIIDQYANYLSAHPSAKVKVAGYTDKSGSRSWNLSLSEVRARKIAKALESRGVKAKQIQIVGYGEEYPLEACKGKTVCWQERHATLNPVG